jgi:hypothetical protein
MMKEEPIDQGDERSTLAADRLFSHAEVGNCSDVGQATHDSSLAEAEGGPSLTDLRHREKPDGLAVRADEVDAIDGYVVLLTEVLDCLAEHVAELDIQLGHEGGSRFCFAKHGEDGLLDIHRNGELVVLF